MTEPNEPADPTEDESDVEALAKLIESTGTASENPEQP
jgi:hypothetical protein